MEGEADITTKKGEADMIDLLLYEWRPHAMMLTHNSHYINCFITLSNFYSMEHKGIELGRRSSREQENMRKDKFTHNSHVNFLSLNLVIAPCVNLSYVNDYVILCLK